MASVVGRQPRQQSQPKTPPRSPKTRAQHNLTRARSQSTVPPTPLHSPTRTLTQPGPTTHTNQEPKRLAFPTFKGLGFTLVRGAFAESTLSTDKRVWETFRRTRAQNPSETLTATLLRVNARWSREKGSTHKRYVLSLAKCLRHGFPRTPAIVPNNVLFQMIRAASRRAGRQVPKQARLISQADFQRLQSAPVAALSQTEKAATEVLLLSLSRFGDLKSFRFRRLTSKGLIRIRAFVDKANPLGRAHWKFSPLTRNLASLNSLRPIRKLKYNTMLRKVQKILPKATLHSFRRTGITSLHETFDFNRISLLSGHSVPTACIGIRRYAEPTPTSKEATRQLQMANTLAITFRIPTVGSKTQSE